MLGVTTGCLEGARTLATSDAWPLSEQQLVNCGTVDSGCNGELMDNIFAFTEENAMYREEDYRDTASKDTCWASGRTVEITQRCVAEYKAVSSDSTHVLMWTVVYQPVRIAR